MVGRALGADRREELNYKYQMVCLLAAAALAALLPGVAMAQGNHQGGTYYPEQIHLSLTGIPGEMVIDWISSVPAGADSDLYQRQGLYAE